MGAGDFEEHRYRELLPINHPELQIDTRRAQAMAVKYLLGRLYTTHITWNARIEAGLPVPRYDAVKRTLELETDITIPDTAHRHLAYYWLVSWKLDPTTIPLEVVVDGVPVSEDEIRELMQNFDPKLESVYVDVYQLSPENEGYLYDEFNSDQKPPAGAVAIDLNPTKTPSRRFVYDLMSVSPIFSREQIETRRNTIGSKSRKLTTVSTLEAAVRPMTKQLAQLEGDHEARADLLDFTAAFFEQYASHHPAWKTLATAEQRQQLRDASFALSNIMFHPLFRVVFRLWEDLHKREVDWTEDTGWHDVVDAIAAPNVMDRDNPAWQGKIMIASYDAEGKPAWSVSSTRQTREAAYQYLCDVAGLPVTGSRREKVSA
jgi:hypothetical protein